LEIVNFTRNRQLFPEASTFQVREAGAASSDKLSELQGGFKTGLKKAVKAFVVQAQNPLLLKLTEVPLLL